MRVRSYNRVNRELNELKMNYNFKFNRRKTTAQWIVRIFVILCVISFFSGVFSVLTGLNSQQGVVSAHEPVEQFNPVKNKRIIVIVIVSDQEEAKELLKKLGVDNARQVAE